MEAQKQSTVKMSANFDDAAVKLATEQAAAEGKTVVIENRSADATPSATETVLTEIALLMDKASAKDVAAKINELVARVNELSKREVPSGTKSGGRDRGPVSEKTMTDDDARRIMLGDLSSKSHKEAAEALKLSYGQVYSARKGFTFKEINKEATKAGKKW